MIDRYYVGQTDNISERLFSHQTGTSPYTSRSKDWELMYTEAFSTRTEVRKREIEELKYKKRKLKNKLL